MLLFIDAVHVTMLPQSRFNTSHVTLYPLYADGNDAVLESFNTSHVTLYLQSGTIFLFAIQFQYISCYSLSQWPATRPLMRRVSIHLMLLFISNAPASPRTTGTFQYISCYSLSERKQFCRNCRLFQYISCYSLSERKQFCRNCRLFQYISCYSLSEETIRTWDKAIEFQYISCYSLSEEASNFQNSNYSFNTSHVTLYRRSLQKNFTSGLGFNTSHVTLYRYRSDHRRPVGEVSIHLMLLFIIYLTIERIISRCFNTSHVTLYQKITEKSRNNKTVSIHLMLLFIQFSEERSFSSTNVSIHLMLLFIAKLIENLIQYSGFNTSHVTLYQWADSTPQEIKEFQYISCYSLSASSKIQQVPEQVSIHLMLLFIPLLYSISHT